MLLIPYRFHLTGGCHDFPKRPLRQWARDAHRCSSGRISSNGSSPAYPFRLTRTVWIQRMVLVRRSARPDSREQSSRQRRNSRRNMLPTTSIFRLIRVLLVGRTRIAVFPSLMGPDQNAAWPARIPHPLPFVMPIRDVASGAISRRADRRATFAAIASPERFWAESPGVRPVDLAGPASRSAVLGDRIGCQRSLTGDVNRRGGIPVC